MVTLFKYPERKEYFGIHFSDTESRTAEMKTIPPNQALQTTTRTVTPAASHPSRQRVSCLI
jgi:hypothetical protein